MKTESTHTLEEHFVVVLWYYNGVEDARIYRSTTLLNKTYEQAVEEIPELLLNVLPIQPHKWATIERRYS